MKTIGIKLADGTFYPILEEGSPKKRMLDLTTAKDNQTKVQIDLYRSETGSMDDAEYVDTLEVTKLKPHPNGEPELKLSVGLDENNELSAEVVDPETGKKSEVQVQLVNLPESERTGSDADFTLPDAIAPDELVAFEEKEDKKPEDEISLPTEDFSFEDFADESLAKDESEIKMDDIPDFDTDSLDEDPTNLDPSDTKAEFAPEELPEIKTEALEDVPFSFNNSDMFSTETPADHSTEIDITDDDLGLKDTTLESIDFGTDLPDFDENPAPEEPAAEETVTADSDFDLPEETSIDDISTDSADSLDLPDFDDLGNDLPDFDTKTEETADEPKSEDKDFSSFDLPDFDDVPKIEDNNTETTGLNFDDFDDSVFNTTDLDTDIPFEDTPSSPAITGSAMDFSDLYDKETLAGEHASLYDNEEEEEKTRVPVIICIICAIICVLATILVLFIVPSKYNLIKTRNTRNMSTEKTVVEKETVAESTDSGSLNSEEQQGTVEEVNETAEIVIDLAPEAKEDEIVISPTPEVTPAAAPEPVAEKMEETVPEKTPDVKYRIKWGDTLWDLSESYYKTPWKYPRIADYNRIKDPDIIISGNEILIPAE